MNKWLLEIMKLQGEIRMLLLRYGMSDVISGDAAGEIMHTTMQSVVVNSEHREQYEMLTSYRKNGAGSVSARKLE